MLEVNLLPVREAKRKADLRQQVMQLVLGLLVVSAGIGFIHSRVTDEIQMANARVRQMENDIEQFKPQLNQVAAFKKKKGELEKKIDVIDGLDRARSGPVRVMDELATRIPGRLWLTSFTTKGKSINLKGESLDNELVALFLGQLVDSKYFKDVDLESTTLGESKEDGLKLVSFSIQAKMADPNAPEREKKSDDQAPGKSKKKKKKGGHA
jgi:type IV pilus assembly protein PilN